MMKKVSFYGVMLILSGTALVNADEEKKLYRWVDEQGNVHFSDQPIKGAEEIEMKLAPSTKMEKPQVVIPPSILENRQSQSITSYEVFTLVEPLENSVIRSNAMQVTLTANLQPELDEEHSLRFFVDGKLVEGEPQGTSVVAQAEEFGQHSASVIVVDAQGKQIQSSATVKFQILNRINPNIKKKQQASRNGIN